MGGEEEALFGGFLFGNALFGGGAAASAVVVASSPGCLHISEELLTTLTLSIEVCDAE